MKSILSPRELAHAIGVSESSLKRWVDDGLIEASRTAGGHRRITIAEAVRFIRETRQPLVSPETLGLADLAAVSPDEGSADARAQKLERYLTDGAAPEARGLILSMYLAGASVAELADGPIASAMARIGDAWRQDEHRGIFIEHRASEICAAAVVQLQMTLAAPKGAPSAVGGAPSSDSARLASLLAATVLAAEGFHAVNLGAHTPHESLFRGAEQHRAALVWLSATHISEESTFREATLSLARRLHGIGARLVVGGRFAIEAGLFSSGNLFVGRSMAELAAFGRGVLGAAAAAAPRAE